MNLLKIAPLGVLVLLGACASPGQGQIQLAQERQACADIGVAPGSGAFSTCVGNLDATMFRADDAAAR